MSRRHNAPEIRPVAAGDKIFLSHSSGHVVEAVVKKVDATSLLAWCIYGTSERFLSEEGIGWSRPEHVAALKVAVAL